MAGSGDVDNDDVDVLQVAIAKQEAVLRSMQSVHGEFHPAVADDLAQLALLLRMRGALHEALPLLHRRLVIHDKFGPEELAADTLQELGTLYRLHGAPDVAQQHLERALAIRTRCHGATSLKAAETLNSLALVGLARGDAAEALQLRSMQALYGSAEPEDSESEDVPWEVFKRLKQQRGPSTARNSVTLLKGTLRQRVLEAAKAAQSVAPEADGQRSGDSGRATGQRRALVSGPPSPVLSAEHSAGRRAVRSQSDSGAMKRYNRYLPDGLRVHTPPPQSRLPATDAPAAAAAAAAPPRRSPGPPPLPLPPRLLLPPIRDFSTLQARVEGLKRRIAGGFPDTTAELTQLAADVDAIRALELRGVGFAMLSLVRELHRLCAHSNALVRPLPALEGLLEKKSASIFRGWEKRWFQADPKTFVLSYHFSRDDHARGFAPRGGFPVARIASIRVHHHARGSWFHFDVVVDLSTRLHPHAARTYELRCADHATLRHWVETLQAYKAAALATPVRPETS
ncbi:hypothetical protein PybrP1_004978 [[Pythium] brassicae (nom. inval.)]|nr:hypothetical protein PybrP1_004978 [[Pythium] brassicae (nom. inval.)]